MCLAESQQFKDQREIEKLKTVLKVEEVSIPLIERYKYEFLNPRVSKKYSRFEFEMLGDREGFKSWWDCDQSALLILDGHTKKAGPDNSDKFWASTAVFDLLEILDKPGNLVIYYFIEPEESMVYDVPTHVIFGHLIWQILRHAPQLARESASIKELKGLSGGKKWQGPQPKEPCDIIGKLLAHIPNTFILLDRIDRCACHPTAVIDSLLGLVRDCKSRVKIFATFGERVGKDFEVRSLDLRGVERQFMRVTLHQTKRCGNSESPLKDAERIQEVSGDDLEDD